MLEKPTDNHLPSVTRAAASPTAIVLAGAGVAIGELAHLGLLAAILLGAVGYGGRVAWAALRRRSAQRRRAHRRLARIDPWSVPEPWRSYTVRAVEARKRFRELARDAAPGPVGNYLSASVAKVDASVEQTWALVRSGVALTGPPGRATKVGEGLSRAQEALARARGAERSVLAGQEESLASELRSLRNLEAAGMQVSSRVSALCTQLEGLVASAGELVATTGAADADLGPLSSELAYLTGALEEARRITATTPGEPPGSIPSPPGSIPPQDG